MEGAIDRAVQLCLWPDAEHVATTAVALPARVLQAAGAGLERAGLVHDAAVGWLVAGRFRAAAQLATGVFRAPNFDDRGSLDRLLIRIRVFGKDFRGGVVVAARRSFRCQRCAVGMRTFCDDCALWCSRDVSYNRIIYK